MEPSRPDWRPHPLILRAVAYAACFVVFGVALALVLEVVGRLGIVLFPVVLAVFLTRVLSVPNNVLLRRGLPPAAAAGLSLVGFIGVLALAGALIGPAVAGEFGDLGDTLSEGTAEIEDWIVQDSSLDVDRADIEDFKDDVEQRSRETLENSTDTIAQGARLVIEILVGFVLALILTFFALKDRHQLHDWLVRLLPRRHRSAGEAAARSAWATLGGYLRGAALLGLVEGVIIGAAMFFTGASLVLPVMLLTFLFAFIPLVGATVAGVIAVLVTLASAGLTPALIVAVVALVVQQFDSDLLAPWIYGKALSLHPAVILLSIASGAALFGIAGTLLAVPLVAIIVNGVAAVRDHRAEGAPEPAVVPGGPPSRGGPDDDVGPSSAPAPSPS